MSSRVSVIVPLHDVADTLERCVESLLGQTLRDIEVVLVDDGSTDGSGAMCDAFALEDHRVVVVHQRSGGVSDARNAGLAVARGELIAFLDGDDWAEPDMLSEMVDVAETTASDVVIAGCFVDVVDREGRLVSSRSIVPDSTVVGPKSPPPAITHDLVNLIGYAWNKLYGRELLRRESADFSVGLSLGEDMVFNAAVLTKTSSVALLDRPLVHYVQHPRTTLGGAFRPDFLELRLRAIEGVRLVLEHWAVETAVTDSVVTTMRVVALRTLARTTSERPGVSIRQKADHLRDTRGGVDGLVRAGHLSPSQRTQFWALRYSPALAVVVAFRARSRWRRLVTPTSGGAG